MLHDGANGAPLEYRIEDVRKRPACRWP